MTPLFSPLFLSAALASAAIVHAEYFSPPDNYHRFATRAQGINWTECTDDSGKLVPNHECGRFEVPLDWHNETAGKASLAVVRRRAATQPRLGAIFFNPGGPGNGGVDWILQGSQGLTEIVNDQYDIVSWDPRGVGRSVPRAYCFTSKEEAYDFWQGSIIGDGLEARGNFTDKRDLDAFYAQVDMVDLLLEEFGKRCIEDSPDTFQYIGTTAVVRDMVALHDLLEGPDKHINYWGGSYGTILGSYFVNMFPDRVGRVLLDGVADPWDWANQPAYEKVKSMLESTDEAFTGFAMACAAAGPSGCAIASENSTTDSIRQWTRDLLNGAYDYRREAGPLEGLSSSYIRSTIFMGLYNPTRWPALAETLAGDSSFLFNRSTSSNSTTLKRSVQTPESSFSHHRRAVTNNTDENSTEPVSGVDYSRWGIRCADAIDAGNTTTRNVFDFVVNVTRTVSPMFGPQFAGAGYLYCHRWPVRAVERFTGPWNSKLSNTILIIGNEADPVTPYISAKRVADALGDSAILIEQDDYGHVSFAMRSDCTRSAIRDYFLNNKLPSQDKFCGTNQILFPGPGVTKSTIAQLASSSTFSNQSTLQTELDKAKQRSQKLFIAVMALAGAACLLLISLLCSCLHRRKSSPPAQSMYLSQSFDKAGGGEQGHTYENPYLPGGGSKGGYSRVES